MGGEFCSVSTCKNSSKRAKRDGQIIRFFRYPKNPLTNRTWIRKCNHPPKFDPKNKRICSSHFKLDDYEDEIQAQIMNYPPMKLKKDAVPSLNLPSTVLQSERSSTSGGTAGRTKRNSNEKEDEESLEESFSNPKENVAVPIQKKDETTMPGGTCSVAMCKTNYMKSKRDGQKIRFFNFPSDPLAGKAWIKSCRRASDFNPKSKRVCSLHFEMSDYEDEIQARLLNYPPKKLKKDAVPSLNMTSSFPETSTTPATSDRGKRYSRKLRKKVVDECFERYKGKNKSIVKNPKEKVTVPITGNNKFSGKNTRKKVTSSVKTKVKASDKNIMKEVVVPVEESNRVSDKHIEQEVSDLIQNEKEVTLPTEESIKIGGKNIEEGVSAPILEENYVDDQNTRVVIVTVPIVTTILQNPNEDCVCSVYQNCLKCQFRLLKEENEALRNRIKICMKNESNLKHANDLAKKRFRKLEAQFESKVKTAFQHFLSPNQVEAVLRRKMKVRWTEEEISKAFNIYQFSKRFYIYIKNNLNYPLPSLSTIKKWILDTTLKIEKDCTLEMVQKPPINSESLHSDYSMHLENLSDHPMDYENLPLDNPTHSENQPSDLPVGSESLKPEKECCNETLNGVGIQIKTLYFPSDPNVNFENPTNKKTSTVAKKNFQFHLSHKNYFTKLILKRHLRKLAKPKRFNCSICQKGFNLNGALKRHFKTHVLENPWTCDVCDEVFSSKYHLDKHITTHRNADKFLCDICDQSFVKKVNFQDHYLKHKHIQPQDVCGKELNIDQCVIEGTSNEQYGTDQFLATQYPTETKIKPYLCHICNELFENKSDLKIHLVFCKAESKSCAKNIYGTKAAYVCEFCNKAFRYRQYFENHLLKHKNRKLIGKKFVCEICDKTFSKPSTLHQHKILHDDNKNKVQFFCNVCPKGFKQKRYLSQHLQTHSDEKPYACVLCPKRFAQNSTLKKHFETHKNESYPSLTDLYA